MINLQTVKVLSKQGFSMAQITAAMNTAEAEGSANLDGWVVRYDDQGKMIVLHPSWCGIYTGDYSSHLIFQKNLSYTFSHYGYMSAKHGDLAQIMQRLEAHKTNGYILCECHAGSYERRRKQLEKLGYTVYKSNITACENEISTCFFLVA